MTTKLKPHPKSFQLAPLSRNRNKEADKKNGMLSHIALSMASDARVMRETPSLRELYAFLGTKPGERPRA